MVLHSHLQFLKGLNSQHPTLVGFLSSSF
jgi:hypothetical protein